MPHIYRAVVRGEFADLDADIRARLAAEVEEHDLFLSSYTAAGTFTYEPNLHAFSFRYEVREPDGDGRPEGDCRLAATDVALARARAELDRRGVTYKRLRATVTNMAEMWADESSSPA